MPVNPWFGSSRGRHCGRTRNSRTTRRETQRPLADQLSSHGHWNQGHRSAQRLHGPERVANQLKESFNRHGIRSGGLHMPQHECAPDLGRAPRAVFLLRELSRFRDLDQLCMFLFIFTPKCLTANSYFAVHRHTR